MLAVNHNENGLSGVVVMVARGILMSILAVDGVGPYFPGRSYRRIQGEEVVMNMSQRVRSKRKPGPCLGQSPLLQQTAQAARHPGYPAAQTFQSIDLTSKRLKEVILTYPSSAS